MPSKASRDSVVELVSEWGAKARHPIETYRAGLRKRFGREGEAAYAVGLGGSLAASAPTVFSPESLWRAQVFLQAGGGGLAGFQQGLCEIGAGAVLSIVLWALAMALLVYAVFDVWAWFKEGRSKREGSSSRQGDKAADAGMKVFGAIVVAGMPTLLASAGFQLLSCWNAVPVF